MHLTNIAVLAGALGAAAHPSAHNHRHLHDKRDLTFVKAVHTVTVTEIENAVVAPATTQPTATPSSSTTPAPVVTTSTSAAPVATTAASTSATSGSGSSGSGSYVPFCGGSSKRATAAEIAYAGNTGTTYGCNIMQVASDIADLYNYTATFTNVASESYELVCWNKIGKTGGINGFFKGQGEAVTFTLAAGASAVIAFESNSQGGCTGGPGSLPTNPQTGEYTGTWLEFDFADAANKGWSGADASALAAVAASSDIYGLQVCHDTDCSTILPGGSGTNAYVAGTADADGIGLNIPAGDVHLSVKVGYQG